MDGTGGESDRDRGGVLEGRYKKWEGRWMTVAGCIGLRLYSG